MKEKQKFMEITMNNPSEQHINATVLVLSIIIAGIIIAFLIYLIKPTKRPVPDPDKKITPPESDINEEIPLEIIVKAEQKYLNERIGYVLSIKLPVSNLDKDRIEEIVSKYKLQQTMPSFQLELIPPNPNLRKAILMHISNRGYEIPDSNTYTLISAIGQLLRSKADLIVIDLLNGNI